MYKNLKVPFINIFFIRIHTKKEKSYCKVLIFDFFLLQIIKKAPEKYQNIQKWYENLNVTFINTYFIQIHTKKKEFNCELKIFCIIFAKYIKKYQKSTKIYKQMYKNLKVPFINIFFTQIHMKKKKSYCKVLNFWIIFVVIYQKKKYQKNTKIFKKGMKT